MRPAVTKAIDTLRADLGATSTVASQPSAEPAGSGLSFVGGSLRDAPAAKTNSGGQTQSANADNGPAGTHFFGQAANPSNPGLQTLPNGPRPSAPSASAQADAAGQTAGTGATMDGSRGGVAGAPIDPFKPAPAKKPEKFRIGGWDDARMDQLASTPRGKEIIEQDKKLRDQRQGTDDRISEIKAKLEKTSDANERQSLNKDWADQLNGQQQIDKQLNDVEKEAGRLIVHDE
jgi:hypothetical protein